MAQKLNVSIPYRYGTPTVSNLVIDRTYVSIPYRYGTPFFYYSIQSI